MTDFIKKIDELLELEDRIAKGHYSVECVHHDDGEISYEVSTPNKGLHVAFQEHNCLHEGISAKAQAEFYTQACNMVRPMGEHIKKQDKALNCVFRHLKYECDCSGPFPNKKPSEIEQKYPCWACNLYWEIQAILESK